MSADDAREPARRRKPWYRLRNIVLAVVLAVIALIVWVFFECWTVYNAEADPRVDYFAPVDRAAREMAGVTEAEGAASWERLRHVSSLAERVKQEVQRQVVAEGLERRSTRDDGLIEFMYLRERTLSFARTRRELRALEALRDEGVFDLLAEFAEGPVGIRIRPADEGIVPDLATELSGGRDLGEARAASMRLALLEGDWADVVAAFDQQLAIAQTISHEGGFISHLFATSIHALALMELCHELGEAEFDAATCDLLLASIEHGSLAPVTLAIEGERATFHELVEEFYSDDGEGGGYMLAHAMKGVGPASVDQATLFDAFLARFVYADRREITRLANEYFDRCVVRAQTPPGSPQEPGEDPESFLATLSERRHAVLRLMAATLERSIGNDRVVQSQLEGARLLIALEKHLAVHGEVPPDLAALVPGFLPAVAIDPMHGGPFGYRRLEDDPDGRVFLLYSFGADGVDDGGAVHPADPCEALGPDGDGTDFVFNAPREDMEE